jgi:all-trans-8'-apo-beta-carotenal 15,15'-oxygenase
METYQRPIPASADDLSYTLTDWQGGYRSQPNEYEYWIDDIEGTLPWDLQGTFFRNGPGLLEINGQRFQHPFDGDGMICSIAFMQGKAYFRNRFVRTEGYLAEQAAGKILYRGVFGTQRQGGWWANLLDLKLKNIANTNVIYWGGKLLALWEAAEPHALNPWTLETQGIDYLDGLLQPGDAFGAHPLIDPGKHLDGQPRLVNFAVKPGLSSTIILYELDAAGALIRQSAHTVPGFAFLHDFALTPNYAIFFQNPVTFNPFPFLFGLRGAAECIKLQAQQPTRILVIPRHSKQAMQVYETAPCFVFHHANAFEDDGNVVIDSICYDSFPSIDPDQDYQAEIDFSQVPPGQLWRFRVDLQAKTVDQQPLALRSCEFPSLHPAHVGQPYRYVYLGATHSSIGNAPLQAIAKLDLQTGTQQVWSAAPQGFVSEPIFVPRPNAPAEQEDAGWLLTLIYNATDHRSEVVILDAQDLTQGPIARLRLKHHIPYGLHGSFTPQSFAPAHS